MVIKIQLDRKKVTKCLRENPRCKYITISVYKLRSNQVPMLKPELRTLRHQRCVRQPIRLYVCAKPGDYIGIHSLMAVC